MDRAQRIIDGGGGNGLEHHPAFFHFGQFEADGAGDGRDEAARHAQTQLVDPGQGGDIDGFGHANGS